MASDEPPDADEPDGLRPDERHGLSGRIAGSTGIASFCDCGLAFFGWTVEESDERLGAHCNGGPMPRRRPWPGDSRRGGWRSWLGGR